MKKTLVLILIALSLVSCTKTKNSSKIENLDEKKSKIDLRYEKIIKNLRVKKPKTDKINLKYSLNIFKYHEPSLVKNLEIYISGDDYSVSDINQHYIKRKVYKKNKKLTYSWIEYSYSDERKGKKYEQKNIELLYIIPSIHSDFFDKFKALEIKEIKENNEKHYLLIGKKKEAGSYINYSVKFKEGSEYPESFIVEENSHQKISYEKKEEIHNENNKEAFKIETDIDFSYDDKIFTMLDFNKKDDELLDSVQIEKSRNYKLEETIIKNSEVKKPLKSKIIIDDEKIIKIINDKNYYYDLSEKLIYSYREDNFKNRNLVKDKPELAEYFKSIRSKQKYYKSSENKVKDSNRLIVSTSAEAGFFLNDEVIVIKQIQKDDMGRKFYKTIFYDTLDSFVVLSVLKDMNNTEIERIYREKIKSAI